MALQCENCQCAFQLTEFIDIIVRCLGAVVPFFISATFVEVNIEDIHCKVCRV